MHGRSSYRALRRPPRLITLSLRRGQSEGEFGIETVSGAGNCLAAWPASPSIRSTRTPSMYRSRNCVMTVIGFGSFSSCRTSGIEPSFGRVRMHAPSHRAWQVFPRRPRQSREGDVLEQRVRPDVFAMTHGHVEDPALAVRTHVGVVRVFCLFRGACVQRGAHHVKRSVTRSLPVRSRQASIHGSESWKVWTRSCSSMRLRKSLSGQLMCQPPSMAYAAFV
jgi:hypothetical protein